MHAQSRYAPWPIIAALVLSTAVVLVSAYVSRQNIDSVAEFADEVVTTGELLDAIARLRNALLAAETGQRGYLLTGDKDYLAPYARAIPIVDGLLDEVRKLSAGKERREVRLKALEPLVAARLAELRSTVDAAERGNRDEAMRIVNSRRGLDAMEASLAILGEIRAEEAQLRVVYKDQLRRQSWNSGVTEFATMAVLLSQIALCYYLLLRYLRQRRESEASMAAANEGLEDEVRERTQELRDLSRYLMSVREDEKARIARELHDEMGSSLTAVNMDLASVQQKLGADSPLAPRLARAVATLRSTVEGMRRIIEDLRPTMLEGLGLREAVRSLASDFSERVGIPIGVDMPEELPPLKEGVPIALFRIVQEALTNASRYASATSMQISLRAPGGAVVLVVEDDGVGIPPKSRGEKRNSHGLLGIRERATAMGGNASIGPGPSGNGTVVRVVLPAAGAVPQAEDVR